MLMRETALFLLPVWNLTSPNPSRDRNMEGFASSQQTGGSGARCQLPHLKLGLGQTSGRKRIWCNLSLAWINQCGENKFYFEHFEMHKKVTSRQVIGGIGLNKNIGGTCPMPPPEVFACASAVYTTLPTYMYNAINQIGAT